MIKIKLFSVIGPSFIQSSGVQRPILTKHEIPQTTIYLPFSQKHGIGRDVNWEKTIPRKACEPEEKRGEDRREVKVEAECGWQRQSMIDRQRRSLGG